MNFLQFYETLFLRDIMFYFLPGGTTLLGLGLIFWLQASSNIKSAVLTYIPSETWLVVVLLLAISYVFGHILYMLHNRTYGRMKSLRRDKIMAGYLEIGKDDKDIPLFIFEFREAIVKSLLDYSNQNSGKVIGENLLQVYFTLDKYILLKKPNFYAIYVSRLTATSRFYGVMSVGWIVLSLGSISFFLTQIIPIGLTVAIILGFCLLSYWFIKSSVTSQQELVWNILQATYLLQREDQLSSEATK